MENNIKDKRKEFGYTQDDLAEILDVSRQTIISIEKGRYNPSLQLAFDIARTFNCSIEDIFFPD
ncbi:helix-turn-helix transcriptional regulator [Piscibacillus halophilus]|uniref:helix-turn-helix transcriptional regulator n=1 Tax=Piscibacillus halophilus TaxID=571933 RepID=UPI000B27CEE6|nr:helix-turn-helix transcriptional regulator [Piscibacillus halophilus]